MRDEDQTKADWGRLFELLDTALDLDPEEREPWIRGLHDVPESLKDRLRKLLAERSRFRKSGFLENPASDSTIPPPHSLRDEAIPTGVRDISILPSRDRAHAPSVGTLIKGRYTLVEELGQGGMGRVFKARD